MWKKLQKNIAKIVETIVQKNCGKNYPKIGQGLAKNGMASLASVSSCSSHDAPKGLNNYYKIEIFQVVVIIG